MSAADEIPLFAPALLHPPSTPLPPNYTLRPLCASDYHRGFLDVLRTLTKVGDIPYESFLSQFETMKTSGDYYIICILNESDKVVAVGSLIIEKKFIRNCSKVGHIEDISVLESEQGKGLGKKVIEALDGIAQGVGCYKSILDCAEEKKGFYEKCGFKLAGLQMVSFKIPGRWRRGRRLTGG